MDTRDLLVTPIVIILVYAVAFVLRRRLTNNETKKFFFPGLTLKIIGAIAVGFIYQYYYDGGDTYNYHTHGSRIIWEAFMTDPVDGINLLFSKPGASLMYRYTSQIVYYTDPSSFFMVKVIALFDLITFSTYSATAVLFAFVSFLGLWFFFLTFYDLFPQIRTSIAMAAFFIPSVIFWGSGILKDTVVMACIGFATYAIKTLLIDKRFRFSAFVGLVLALFLIFSVKKYVLLCFLPAAIFWVYAGNLSRVRSAVLRMLLVPVVIIITVVSGFFAVREVGKNDPRYAFGRLAETARTTAYDIGFYTGKNAGSRYSLGELDGSFQSMLALAPQGVNVALFRPYLWEVRNPLMLLSAIEATALLLVTVVLLLRWPLSFLKSLGDPNVLFCLVFSLTFAFAVGVSTFNFGTLVRYRIPLLPFYTMTLILIAYKSRSKKELHELETTELHVNQTETEN